MKLVIEIKNLSKSYVVRQRQAGTPRYHSLRDAIVASGAKAFRFLQRGQSQATTNEKFWALHDVSMKINEGEVVGIVGRNGAGKSTLLKLLARVTAPTSGEARIYGRVGSLLEVGTGFHPELSGRENVYLNGAILGLKRREITRVFDAIVDFAGVASFIDMPIKRYSSGMQMRLAFAVAAHLEPEIMIVDEVLAVGDAAFQRQCLGKMRDVAASGRTVIFVSHNLSSINQLCNRCVYLDQGRVVDDSDDVSGVIEKYLSTGEQLDSSEWINDDELVFNELLPQRMRIIDEEGRVVSRPIDASQQLTLEITCKVLVENPNLAIGYALYDVAGNLVYYTYHTDEYNLERDNLLGQLKLSSLLPMNLLNDGEYVVKLIAGIMHDKALLTRGDSDCRIKLVVSGNAFRSGLWIGKRPSHIAPVLTWNITHEI